MSAEAAKQNVSLQRINERAASCVCVCYFPNKRQKDVRPNMCVCLWRQETTVYSEGGARASLCCAPQPADCTVWLRLLYHHWQSQALLL